MAAIKMNTPMEYETWAYTSGTSTTAGNGYNFFDPGLTVGYYAIPQEIEAHDISGEFMEVSFQPSFRKVKRVSLFGRLVSKGNEDDEKQSILALQWIKGAKQKLTKEQQKEYQEKAEKAFQEAVKNMQLGMKDVSKNFEFEMEKFLNLSSPSIKGYDTFITNKEINEFRKHLPKTKELVIDEIDEYEKPLPKDIQEALKKARDAKVFEKFVIFWIRRVADPILFGMVKGQTDKFYYIAEWDNDVSIQDFLKYRE